MLAFAVSLRRMSGRQTVLDRIQVSSRSLPAKARRKKRLALQFSASPLSVHKAADQIAVVHRGDERGMCGCSVRVSYQL